ncbi:MAG: ligase-associated DNA damage response endonuclease PdeM [Sulfitobacter sp.]|uniref:ligase-associated DNA damage response endonuclease PdeM n=1 Tax=unclassified Sulfitobacter TaxID=196795 RepID=UPI002942F84B|nr:ligase-associated DNA damage response endonuclease PdeM [Sulfitobacter sp. LC.270.F.C4]WOI16582.1 ligase-associated DNA damage response endonuclease PdeM [Sulfitobacter sp. LC.270.F.C4]
MNSLDFSFAGAALTALGSGALLWRDRDLLCVSDLHLGKSERIARRGGSALPPYETRDTLNRLAADLSFTQARHVICLGDSFDDLGAAQALPEEERLWILGLQAGRRWDWIEGNHDPGPVGLGGTHLGEIALGPLTFRHIAASEVRGEVSGHYHPKASIRARGRSISRPAFLFDSKRLILPAYGTYTGGLRSQSRVLCDLMGPEACAVLTGAQPVAIPMPGKAR